MVVLYSLLAFDAAARFDGLLPAVAAAVIAGVLGIVALMLTLSGRGIPLP